MAGIELTSLDSKEADAYFRAFVAGRRDLPTTDVTVHMNGYLALPPDEQRTFFALREGGRIVGTVRLAGTQMSFFSLVPDARRWTRDAVLAASDILIARGADRIVATFDDSYAADFERLGFKETFSRIRMEAPLSRRELPAVPMAHPELTDVPAMSEFFMRLYEGHLEQQLGMHVGGPAEWREYVTSNWKGDAGRYLPLASWASRDDAGLAGVCLTTEWMGLPLIAEVGVRKDARRKGLGRALMVAAMNSLVDLNFARLALYVTIGNEPALALYASLGFTEAGRTVNAVREFGAGTAHDS